VSGAIAVVSLIVTTRTVRRLRADRLEFDFALAAHKFNLDKALAEIRAAADRRDRVLPILARRPVTVIVASSGAAPLRRLTQDPMPTCASGSSGSEVSFSGVAAHHSVAVEH
jgi:hypothetical protein